MSVSLPMYKWSSVFVCRFSKSYLFAISVFEWSFYKVYSRLGCCVSFFFSWYFMSSTFSLCVWVCVCVCVFLWIVSMSKHRAERERERREWNTGYSNLWTTLKGFAFSLNQWVWVVDIDGFLIHFTFHRPTQMGLKCRETASRMVLQYEEPHIRDSLDKGIKTNKSL